jgi:uncharacterized membrane protein YkvI
MDWFSEAGLILGMLGLLVITCMLPLLSGKYKEPAMRMIEGGIGSLIIGMVIFVIKTDGWFFGVKVFGIFCPILILIVSLVIFYKDYKEISKEARK